MALGQSMRAVGVLPNRQAVEVALNALKESGFSMNKVSVVAKDASDRGDQLSDVDISDPVAAQAEGGGTTGTLAGTAIGGLGGLFVGLSAISVPGVGPVLAAGTLGTLLATTLAGSGIGAVSGQLVGAFAGLGIPSERASIYGGHVSQGNYVVMVEGTEADLQQAESILANQGIQEWGTYAVPDSSQTDSETETQEIQASEHQVNTAPSPQGKPEV